MSQPTLYHIPYSPWSERARWALRHHGVPHERVFHQPVVGEPGLRRRMGRWRGKLTLPVLLTEAGPLTDSYEIARYAEAHGRGAPLFPDEAEVARWNGISEAILAAGRQDTVLRTMASPEATLESLPKPAQGLPKRLGLAVGAWGGRYLQRKYPLDSAEYAARMREGLLALREGLDAGGGHLLGAYSYADITMATALAFVKPVDDAYIRLGPHSRGCWTHPTLSEEFADLIAWRDALYAARRKAKPD